MTGLTLKHFSTVSSILQVRLISEFHSFERVRVKRISDKQVFSVITVPEQQVGIRYTNT